ncbi:F-box/kelch-repeat protein At1g16250-like [Juglans microcarpa x Juglans regia]|uniref:F-box/kelch-repeat protein At1g16250-like n=1 Tax=Juglans microcarpa x Juglans regia TaxID=2249226 RepID=UPI001B7E141F|nr:F-box/kelch-repeat protein At1g16250-like [Juglans microcarpa x Juglans regia]
MSNWIEGYNPSNNAWHYITRIPGLIENQVLKGFSMISMGNSIFIIGGRLCHKMVGINDVEDPDEIVEVDLEVISTVLRYDVRDDAWFKCAPMHTPRFDFACTVCDNKIYVAGGQCTLASARGISLAEVYDPVQNLWTALPNMSTSRYKCVGVRWKGKVHVVGGFTGNGNSWDTMERSSAEIYDSECAKWGHKVGMWQLDVPPNQIVAGPGGKLFSSGDCLNAWKGQIEAYDEDVNIWKGVEGSHYPALSYPTFSTEADSSSLLRRLFLTMAPIGTHFYFLAGYRMPGDISAMMSVVHVFDTSTNVREGWRSFEPVEEDREKELCSHCCAFEGDHEDNMLS